MEKKVKILHFEDEPFLTQMYAKYLNEAGFIYTFYTNPPQDPKELINLVKKENPDLIIMGIIMPQMDGYTATKILKKNQETNHYPILGLDNLGQPEDKQKALDLGMEDYLIMAEHTPDQLVEKVTDLLKKLGIR